MSDPEARQALLERGARAQTRGDLALAAETYKLLLETHGPDPDALANLSMVHLALGARAEAETCAREALRLAPERANTWNNLGLILKQEDRQKEAIDAFERCLALNRDHTIAMTNLAALHAYRRSFEEAAPLIDRAIALDPSSLGAVEMGVYVKMILVDWDGLDRLTAAAMRLVRQNRPFNPYGLFTCCLDPAELHRAAQNHARAIAERASSLPAWEPRPVGEGGRIRVGYASTQLRSHAGGYLTQGVLAAHDKARFETFAYTYCGTGADPVQRRILRSFDHTRDIFKMSYRQAIETIRADRLDILVDLNGYSDGGRTAIFAARCAPIQVNWLAYAGTMGARFMDYIIADEVVLPPEHEPFFSERVARLPGSFFPGDIDSPVEDPFGSRRALGLPEGAVVLCAFNQPKKIIPPMLDAWAVVLRSVPSGLLWFWVDNATARRNLVVELQRRGVASDRVVFAPSHPRIFHLARYRYADLVLDSYPYNSHTMACDALLMGCPLLTLTGRTFPSRVAASLLTALGLPELITDTMDDYVARAIRLATDAQARRALRAKLGEPARRRAVFDGAVYARKLEEAYRTMIERARSGADGGATPGAPST